MQKIGDHSVRITLSDKEFERIQEIAKKHNLKYAQVVRNMCLLGIDLYDDLEIVGVVKALELYEAGSKVLQKMKKSKQLRLA